VIVDNRCPTISVVAEHIAVSARTAPPNHQPTID